MIKALIFLERIRAPFGKTVFSIVARVAIFVKKKKKGRVGAPAIKQVPN
jgi:hypothetical protein